VEKEERIKTIVFVTDPVAHETSCNIEIGTCKLLKHSYGNCSNLISS
jgi:hypothetical protein